MVSGEELVRSDPVRFVFQAVPFRVMSQEETSVALQETVVGSPEVTRVGVAEIETAGEVTMTDVLLLAEPPGPVQVSWKLAGFVVSGTESAEPDVLPPVSNPPAATQEVAFVEDQVRVVLLPEVTVVGDAERAAVGGGAQVKFCEEAASEKPAEFAE